MHPYGNLESADTMPAKAKPEWPPTIIAGAYQTGVRAVRGLKRRGVRSLCFDSNAENPGFYSTYGPARLCPDPDIYPDDWLRFMPKFAEEFDRKPVLIASSDQYVSTIAKHAQNIENHYVLSGEIAIQGLLAEKNTQYALAEKHGMPMPRTRFVSCLEEAVDFACSASFPCLIKPIHFREWRRVPERHPLYDKKIAIAKTAEELTENYKVAEAINPLVILQEIVEGKDTDKRVYLSCYDVKGKRIANAMFRELRCAPIGFGHASVSESAVDAETDEICDKLLKAISYKGICEIEVKRDERDDQVKLIEVNPRLSGGGDAAPYDGVDLCWSYYLDLIGERVTLVASKGKKFKHIVLRADAQGIPTYLETGKICWTEVFASYHFPLAFFDLDFRDLRYSAETLFVAVRSLASGFLARRSV